MDIVVGDETGLVKLVTFSGNNVQISKCIEAQSRSNAVISLTSLSNNEFALVRSNHVVEYWKYSIDDSEKLNCVSKTDGGKIEDQVMGIGTFIGGVYSFSSEGKITLFPTRTLLDHDDENILHSFNIKAPLSVVKTGFESTIACGGKENDLFLFDIGKEDIAWKAKNVPWDNLHLRVPIWITAIDFIAPNLIVTGTAHKQVRLYDTRNSDPRPVKSIDIGEYRVSSLVASENLAFVGDASGDVQAFDLRTWRRSHTLKGNTGSVRSMQFKEDENIVVCGGLDRHIRWYDSRVDERGAIKGAIYVTNRINCLQILSLDVSKLHGKKRGRDSDSDEDDAEKLVEDLFEDQIEGDEDEDGGDLEENDEESEDYWDEDEDEEDEDSDEEH